MLVASSFVIIMFAQRTCMVRFEMPRLQLLCCEATGVGLVSRNHVLKWNNNTYSYNVYNYPLGLEHGLGLGLAIGNF